MAQDRDRRHRTRLTALAAGTGATTLTFDQDRTGAVAADWIAGVTAAVRRAGTIETDVTAPSAPQVLKQSGHGTFPLVRAQGRPARRRICRGEIQAALRQRGSGGRRGLALQDGDHYYVARANALENNVSLYYTEGGRRKTLKLRRRTGGGQAMACAASGVRGSRIRVLLDGTSYIEVEDHHLSARVRSASGPRPTA